LGNGGGPGQWGQEKNSTVKQSSRHLVRSSYYLPLKEQLMGGGGEGGKGRFNRGTERRLLFSTEKKKNRLSLKKLLSELASGERGFLNANCAKKRHYPAVTDSKRQTDKRKKESSHTSGGEGG